MKELRGSIHPLFLHPLSLGLFYFFQVVFPFLSGKAPSRDPGLWTPESPPACQPAQSVCVFPEPHHPASVSSHEANEKPSQASLGDQLGFVRFPKLIMPPLSVQFWQLMYLCIHGWLFVFHLSDMCEAVPSSLHTCVSLSRLLILISGTAVGVLVLSDRNQQGKLNS